MGVGGGGLGGVGQGYEEAMPGDHSPGGWHCVVCCGRGSPGIGAYCLACLVCGAGPA